MADAESFEPLVHLEQVDVDSGEGDEDVVFKERAKLYRFNNELNEWRERGTGDARLLKHRENQMTRFILRQEKTLKVVANHLLNPFTELQTNMGSDRSWVWVAEDFADGEMKVEQFALRFKTPEVAQEFKEAYDKYRAENGDVVKKNAEKTADRKEKDEEEPEQPSTQVKSDESAPAEPAATEKDTPAPAQDE